MRHEYEKSMTAEDLQYLIDNSDKENAIKHYQELLDKIQGGQEPTGTLRFDKGIGDGEQQGESGGEGSQEGHEGEGTVPQGEAPEKGTDGGESTEQTKEEEPKA